MTTDQIDKMIEQCVCHSAISTSRDQLRALVRMAVEAEREECAKVCEKNMFAWMAAYKNNYDLNDDAKASGSEECATLIRNRKEQP